MDVSVSADGGILTLATQQNTTRFHAIWLRDNSPDPDTKSSGNGQRLIALRDIPKDTRISNVQADGGSLDITFAPEEKTASFDLGWLVENAYDVGSNQEKGWLSDEVTKWDSTLQSSEPSAKLSDLAQRGEILQRATRRWADLQPIGPQETVHAMLRRHQPREPGCACRRTDGIGTETP